MIPLSIRNATDVYGNASQCEIVRHSVDHPGLAEVSALLRTLANSLGDEVSDEFWRQTLGPIRRATFSLCSTPLPFAHVAASNGPDWDKLNRQARLCKQLFPDSHEQLEELIAKLRPILLETSSPFINPLEELHRDNDSLSVVMRNPRMNRLVADFFAGSSTLRNAKAVSATQLRGAHYCHVLAAIGPCSWFPEYVFSAPRAAVIHVISYCWIWDTWKPEPLFLHNANASNGGGSHHRIGAMPRIRNEPSGISSAPADLIPADLLPPMPTYGQTGFPFAGTHPSNGEETVQARLCYLTGGRAVFVTADDKATSLVIDTSELGAAVARRVPVDELQQGLYLLLRTSGGGDFIVPLADRILGASAPKRRSEQAEWKERLHHAAVERFGSLGRRELASLVCSDLHSQGLSQARPANVHYWMSSKCIIPRKFEDFAAVLKVAGIEAKAEAEALWLSMKEIDRAHRRAGHLIRRMLLQKIADTSLEPLERDGEMNFDLGDQDGGTLSAVEIIGLAEEKFDVPTDQIGVLLEMED